jgi:protein MpaA
MRAALVCALALAAIAAAPAVRAGDGADAAGRRTFLLGRSVDGRPLHALELGDLDGQRSALVVGCIHGNECAGIAIATRLAELQPPPETDLWIVANLNPDGAAAGTRGNARGVDLNRNFPWRWRPLFGGYYSGSRPSSEPETRVVLRLLARIRPTVSIWFHQHLDLVDDPAAAAVAERFADAAGLRLGSLPREPGSATTWESHCLLGGAAFVVELPAGRVPAARALRFARAVNAAVTSAPARRPSLKPSCRGL